MDLRRINEEWIIAYVDDFHRYISDQGERDKDAERRHKELLRAHQDGWKGVASAIERGLGAIADAIRDNQR